MTRYNWRAPKNVFPTRFFAACLVLLLLFFPNNLFAADISVPILRLGNADYVVVPGLAKAVHGHLYDAPRTHKVELRFDNHRCVFTSLSSVVTVDEEAYRLPVPTRYYADAMVVSTEFLSVLSRVSGKKLHPVLTAQIPPPAPVTQAVEPVPTEQALPPKYEPGESKHPKTAGDATPKATSWTLKTVVIDPGHGGKDPGAIGPKGTQEKTIVLSVAKRLQKMLEKDLQVQVILTREDDTFISLRKRSQIALQQGGKIFISLHCNATKNKQAHGFEVYFLSEAKTQAAAEVARLENAVLEKYEGVSTDSLSESVDRIRYSLLSSQFLKESQELAAAIQKEMAHHATTIPQRGVKQANFFVMRNTMAQMPSVLVELGFVTHREEEKLLRSNSHQDKLAQALYQGIKTFKQRYEQQLSAGH
jgi:N-acetylmuramoyl-L-alanine amidase